MCICNIPYSFKNYVVFMIFFPFTILYVIADSATHGEVLRKKFPGSFDQEKELASTVCDEIEAITPSKACQKNFLDHRGTYSESPPELQIVCQSEATVTFLTNATKNSQLIVLVNDENIGEIINYNIVNGSDSGNTSISTIYSGKIDKNYTFWTALLDAEGKHSIWKQGPVIQPWKELTKHLQRRHYDIKTNFLLDRYENGSYVVEALFSWNSTDVSDSCFRVHNTCNKKTQGDFFEKRIKPQDGRSVVVDRLPLDDKCAFLVTGKYGNSTLVYSTPACHRLPGCDPLPEIIEDLTINAVEDEDGLWVVEVEWKKPKYNHDSYNVTLRAKHTVSKLVPGNYTGVTFSDVTGEGLYNVTVISVIDNVKAVTSNSALFPARSRGPARLVVSAAWAAALLGTVAAAALAAVTLAWRIRRYKRRRYYYTDIQNPKDMKFSDADTAQELFSEGSDQWELRTERLQLHEIIGEGAFGVVRRGTLLPDGRDVAVKMLKDFPTLEEVRSFRSEAELMKSVGAHPHVVSLLGCCSGRRPLLVAEYCARGDLLSYLRCAWDVIVSKRNVKYCNNKQNVDYRNELFKKNDLKDPTMVVNQLYDIQGVCDTELTILDLLSFCRQIAMGMEFLAANRVIHRDLAARNVLVTADRTLKVADFGLSRDVYQENQYRQKGNGKMPVKWMALESLTHRIYTSQSDVWSFGVVMWEVVTLGGAPYAALDGARLPRLLRAGYRMPRPYNCSPQLYEIMMSCWHERPRSRPTFTELRAALDALLAASAHPYLPLQVPAPPAHPPPPATHRYMRMLLGGARVWNRGRSFEPPNCTKRNHYIKTHNHNTLKVSPHNGRDGDGGATLARFDQL